MGFARGSTHPTNLNLTPMGVSPCFRIGNRVSAMFNAEARKYITEEVLSASRSPDAARRGQQATGEAAITAEAPSAPPYSPIVLAGSVRLFELLLVFLAGIVAFVSCVMPFGGFNWMYVVGSACIALVTMFAFQFADIYQVQAFRGHERQ